MIFFVAELTLRNTNRQEGILRNHTIPSQNSIHVSPEDRVPFAKESLTTLYILVALGPVISLILFVVVGQLYKKYKSSKRKPLSKKRYGEDGVFSDLPQEDNHASYSRTSESFGSVHMYRPIEAEYEEINESVEVEMVVMDHDETPMSPCGCLPNIHENTCSCSKVIYSNAEQTVEDFNKAVNSPDTYLTPLFVSETRSTSNREGINAYINVTT